MVILDTHVWIWLINSPAKLTKEQLEFVQNNIGKLAISIVSVWEVVMLVYKGRLDFGVPWGCGVFKNNREQIAESFYDALNGQFKGVFDKIVFVILDRSKKQLFIRPFAKIFS